MGFRNHISRAVFLLILALGVGIAVAILSGRDRVRTLQGRSLPVIEHQTDERLAKPLVRSAPRPSCALQEGCAHL